MPTINPARRWIVPAMVVASLLALPDARAAAPHALTTGFNADISASSGPILDEATAEGAGIIRENVFWSRIAPTRPVRPTDPADPAYKWASLDEAVRDVSAHGLTPLLTVVQAPGWAEGAGRPPVGDQAPAGSWRPDPAALRSFAIAAATRYSGTYPDAARPGASLPAVRYWQAWNEPNLWLYLTPQWTGAPGRYQLASPGLYRSLLNAVYAGVKSVTSRNVVVSAGTAPYGDHSQGAQRVPPVMFWRSLLCLSDHGLRPLRCPDPAHLDIVSHHPYGVAGPERHAVSSDDAAVPDINRITRVVQTAERRRRILPRGGKRVWVTEISWDSSPPDPAGVPAATHAAWVEQADYVLWRQGVDTVLWLQIRDAPPQPDYASSYQAGMFLLDGTPKPAAVTYRYPFLVTRVGGSYRAWGKAPSAGSVTIQRALAGGWRTVRRVTVGRSRVFFTSVRVHRPATLRAVSGGDVSAPWKLFG